MNLRKLILAVMGAAALLGALVSSASARNLSNTSQPFTSTWNPMNYRASLGTIECEVTLSGSLTSATYAKTSGARIGYITDARFRSPCRRGEATVLTETLPWELQYAFFVGALPNITAIRTFIIGFAYRFGLFGISCLLRSEASNPATAIYNREGGGRIASVELGGTIPSSGCGEVTLSGRSVSNTANTVTLI